MDFSALSNYFVVVVLIACLILGYCLKHGSFFSWIPNSDIPIILAVFGAVLNLSVSGLSIESGVYGALMGLASTGMHQGFKRFIEGGEAEPENTDNEKQGDE